MTERIEQLIEHVETVVYAIVALLLFGIAGVVLVRAALSFGELTEASVIEVSAGILDLLLLVFIVVELLFAVRTTLSRRELIAEPFLLVGIIASIKEIVVLSVKAPDVLGTPEFADTARLIALLTGTVILLAIASFLLRRKEREPSEGANSGHGTDELPHGTDHPAQIAGEREGPPGGTGR